MMGSGPGRGAVCAPDAQVGLQTLRGGDSENEAELLAGRTEQEYGMSHSAPQRAHHHPLSASMSGHVSKEDKQKQCQHTHIPHVPESPLILIAFLSEGVTGLGQGHVCLPLRNLYF